MERLPLDTKKKIIEKLGALPPQEIHDNTTGLLLYTLDELLHISGNSVVFSSTYMGHKIVLKIVKYNSLTKPIVHRELEIQSLFKHPNIMKILDFQPIKNYDMAAIVFERMVFGDLFDFVLLKYVYTDEDDFKEKKYIYPDEQIVAWIAYQIICIMEYMHQNNYMHGDIKPENFLIRRYITINGFDIPEVSLTDFGFSRPMSPDSRIEKKNCTPQYVDTAKYLTLKSDVYSFGALIYVLLLGTLPKDPNTGLFSPSDKFFELSENAQTFIYWSMDDNVERRATFEDLKKCGWLSDYDISSDTLAKYEIVNVIDDFESHEDTMI